MTVALALALAAHALVLLGVDFRLPEPRPAPDSALEVMLVTQPGPAPETPDPEAVAAQHSRSGETRVPLPELETPVPDVVAEAIEALALDDAPQPAPEPEPPPPAQPETEPAPEPALAPEPAPEPPAEPADDLLTADTSPASVAPRISAADILASRSDEIGRLAASIERKGDAYARRVRRRAISSATREYRYASYMEAWRRKVERIGNLNYPEEAKRQGVFGNLILHVAVRADGSLEDVRIVRSSGHELLDQAAIRIVELAAPFAAFPPDIRAETDVLDITRTWQFQRNNQLGWAN